MSLLELKSVRINTVYFIDFAVYALSFQIMKLIRCPSGFFEAQFEAVLALSSHCDYSEMVSVKEFFKQ